MVLLYIIIKQASTLLYMASLTMLYNSLCLPYMPFYCEIWGSASAYLLNKISLFQTQSFLPGTHKTII